MEPEETRYVCHACIDDEVLAQEVENAGTRAECNYCSAAGTAMNLTELAGRIHQVVEGQFEQVPVFLETPSDEQTEGLWFHFRSYLEDTQTLIKRVAKLSDVIANDVREFLLLGFTEDANVNDGGHNPYDKDMFYQEREGDPSDFRLPWWEFRNEIEHRARFFSPVAAARLDEIFADLNSLTSWFAGPAIRHINPGDSDSYFWRGRAVYSDGEVKKILDSPSQEMGPPPSNKARAGRMNAEGIPVFYGGLEEETCLAEIRAPVGSCVALGRFVLTTRASILDLQALSMSDTEVSNFDPKYREARSRQRFLWEWVQEIGRPVMPHEEVREYVASQAVADYLANREDLRLDGMIFRSSQTGGKGRNIVLFNRASKVAADDPNTETGTRVIMPPQLTIPPPGTDPNRESTVQTDPPEPSEEDQQQDEVVTSDDLAGRQDDRNTTLRLDRESLKFLQITGVRHEFEELTKNKLHYLTISATVEPMSSTAVLYVRNPQ